MLALRQALKYALLVCVAAAVGPVWAQGKLEARYTVTLAGIPVGKGSWLIEINDTHYSAAASGTTTGLLHVFNDGHGNTATRGTLQGGRPVSSLFSSTIIAGKKADEVRITIANGSVKEFSVEPPQDKAPERIPITEADRRDVLDPMTASLLHVFNDGHGNTATRGTLQGGRPVSSLFSSTIIAGKKADEVRITIANGSVKEFSVEPPQDKAPERIPITEAHRRDVLDPMTASLLHVPGNGDPLKAEACKQTLAIFDGRLRYDLQFEFKRMDKVKSDKGYAGPVVVCAVYFTPVAGYIATRSAIRYIAKLRDIEVWMAPIAGTRVLAPYRVQGPTPIGPAVLEANEFVSVAVPTRASTNGPKTQ